jgi:ribosomal-protein-alanine N-acetyltransferase
MKILSTRSIDFKLTEHLKSQIIKMDTDHFPFPWSSAQWDNIFDREQSYMTLSLNNDTLIGFSLFEINSLEEMAHLYKIYVDPLYREQKIAKKMLSKSSEDFKQLELKSIFLEVALYNNNALSLYRGFGFDQLNVIKKFYSDGSDAIAMQKIL